MINKKDNLMNLYIIFKEEFITVFSLPRLLASSVKSFEMFDDFQSEKSSKGKFFMDLKVKFNPKDSNIDSKKENKDDNDVSIMNFIIPIYLTVLKRKW